MSRCKFSNVTIEKTAATKYYICFIRLFELNSTSIFQNSFDQIKTESFFSFEPQRINPSINSTFTNNNVTNWEF